MLRKKSVQYFWLTLGWISFAVGFIGIFVPLLPTTPFMILAAFCFDKGSPKLHAWILNLPHIGVLVRDWKERKIISKKAKMLAIPMISIGIISMWIGTPDRILSVKIIIAILMLFLIYLISKQKTE